MDRPIIFSAPMVRALLDGRKTQTRRVLNPQPVFFDVPIDEGRGVGRAGRPNELWPFRCMGTAEERDFQRWAQRAVPLYAAGDRLWVREAHMFVGGGDPGNPIYQANWREDAIARHMQNLPADEPKGWRPSIHLPRWASRLTLLVSEVRVQRLLDISEQDADAEGVCHFVEESHGAESFKGLHGADRTALVCSVYGSSRNAFRHLWEHLNGADAWDANPWVAAISFTVHRANIDALDIGAAA